MKAILEHISDQTGTNFLEYKASTLERRLAKRLDNLGINSYDDYLNYLKNHPDEVNNAYKTMLLGISEFFRDLQVFENIRAYLTKIIANKSPENPIRLWAVGCSNGEEAYSLAILLAELLGNPEQYNVKLFASDISEQAINHGRKGIYSEKALLNLSQEQINHYFFPVENGYQVRENIRKMVTFCQHDITKDPPFLHIDLITCRNLLIYFNETLQKRIIPIFNYGLVDNGYLVIGKSENIDDHQDLFDLAETKTKIYQSLPKKHNQPLHFFKLQHQSNSEQVDLEGKSKEPHSITEMAKETIANTYEHPFVVIDQNNKVLETCGTLRAYLGIDEGISSNILEMVNEELHHDLHTALIKCKKEWIPYHSKPLNFELFGQEHWVQIDVRPLISQHQAHSYYFLVIFRSLPDIRQYTAKDAQPASASNQEADKDFLINSLREELNAAKEHLETYRKELEASEAETQSLTEELQSANEELKSANEELETSNEELQSLNEELNAKNQELKKTNQELEKSQQELSEREAKYRLLTENTNDIITLQNNEGIITYISPSVKDTLGYSPEEMMGYHANNIIHPDDLKAIQAASYQDFIQGKFSKNEYRAQRKDGQYIWVETLTKPIFDENGELIHIQNSTRETTEKKNMTLRLRESEARFRNLVETSPVGILIHQNHQFVFINKKGVELLGGNSMNDFTGKAVKDIIHPDYRQQGQELIDTIYSNQKDLPSIETVFQKLSGETFEVELGATSINYEGQPASQTVFRDITQKKKDQRAIFETKEKLRAIIENTNDHIWLVNQNYRVEEFNQAFADRIYKDHGFTLEKGMNIIAAIREVNPEIAEILKTRIDYSLTGNEAFYPDEQIVEDGPVFQVSFLPVENEDKAVTMVSIMAKDITDRKQYENALKENEERFDLALSTAGIGTWDWHLDQESLIWDERNHHIYGLTPDQVNPEKDHYNRFLEHVHEADYPHVVDKIQKACEGRETFEKTYRIIDPQAKERHVYSVAKTFKDEQNNPYRILGINWEITQSKKDQEKLRMRNRAIENAGEGIVITAGEGDYPILFVNEKFCEMTGYSRQESEGYNWRFLQGPETDPETIRQIRSALEKGQEFKGEIFNYRKDGTPFWNHLTISPVKDEEGAITHYVGFQTDITERKNDEEKIKLLSRFPEDNPNPVIRISREGEILYANQASEEFIEYWRQNSPQAIPESFQALITESLSADKSQNLGTPVGKRYYNITINPNQEDQYVFLYAIDITEQKEAEEELRKHQHLLESINQHINEGIFRSTPEEGVIYVNEPFARMFGYDSAQEVLETESLELYANKGERDRLLNIAEEESGFQNKEVLFKRKEGTTFWGLLSSKYLQDENGQVYFDGAIRDISEQKEIEGQLIEAKEKAEEMSRLKSNFLANMSHEIRTPINGIMGLAQIMEEEYKEQEGLGEYTKMIRESSERLLNTITSILDFSKLESKQLDLDVAPIDVNHKIENLAPHLRVLAEKKGIALKKALAEEPLYTRIDEHVFDQIINNLVGNAIKFTHEGSVTIKSSEKSNDQSKLLIEIIDTGIGISEENVEKIFSPFEQESQGHSRDYEGTGLGLSIVKKYVELFGGNIKVVSEKSGGSNFQITLPKQTSLE